MEAMLLLFVLHQTGAHLLAVPKHLPEHLGQLIRLHKSLGLILAVIAGVGDVESGPVAVRRIVGRIRITAAPKPFNILLGTQD